MDGKLFLENGWKYNLERSVISVNIRFAKNFIWMERIILAGMVDMEGEEL